MSFREVEQAGWTTRADKLLPRPSSTRRRHDGDDCSDSCGISTIANPGDPSTLTLSYARLTGE